MLIHKAEISSKKTVAFIMSNLFRDVEMVESTLKKIAGQARDLGTGLQNAAPGDRLLAPNNSVSYLMDVYETFTKMASDCEKLKDIPTPDTNFSI